MRLYYYRDQIGNFGDDLNVWLWPKLLPGVLDRDESSLFLGIGTLISDQIPAAPRKLVFGSGVGYFKLPALDAQWDFQFVRGPRTAERLGLPPRAAITDSALLVRSVLGAGAGGRDVSFIPHHISDPYADWRGITRDAGLRYVDPTGTPESVLAAIGASRLVITEAMHGAILADALRVPWIGVKAYPHINEFKWGDWTETVEVPLELHRLPTVHDQTHARPLRRAAAWLRQMRRTRTFHLREVPPQVTGPEVRDALVAELRRLAGGGAPERLSSDAVYARLFDRLQGEVERLRADHAAGRRPTPYT